MGKCVTPTLPSYQGQRVLSNLIKNYKNGTNVPSTPASLIQEMSKRHKPTITPEDLKPAAVPNLAMIDVHRQLFTAFMQLTAMNPTPINE